MSETEFTLACENKPTPADAVLFVAGGLGQTTKLAIDGIESAELSPNAVPATTGIPLATS